MNAVEEQWILPYSWINRFENPAVQTIFQPTLPRFSRRCFIYVERMDGRGRHPKWKGAHAATHAAGGWTVTPPDARIPGAACSRRPFPIGVSGRALESSMSVSDGTGSRKSQLGNRRLRPGRDPDKPAAVAGIPTRHAGLRGIPTGLSGEPDGSVSLKGRSPSPRAPDGSVWHAGSGKEPQASMPRASSEVAMNLETSGCMSRLSGTLQNGTTWLVITG